MHLMFSERAVTEATRAMAGDRLKVERGRGFGHGL
jgi:hypothetical protein